MNNHGGGGEVSSSTSPQHQRLRVKVVRCTHEFKPSMNDELHIRPGEEIVITQELDGGWWEGTLGSKTGWFPSNYVVPLEDSAPSPDQMTDLSRSDEYRDVIVTELVESEVAYVREMEEFYDRVVKNIGSVVQGSDPVVGSLQASYSGLIGAHRKCVLGPLQGQFGIDDGRVGKVFMDGAGEVAAAHTSYCSQHPKFVQLVEKHSEKLEGPDKDGVLRIITGLSAPFRRIERYGAILEDLQKHVGVNHSDRGELQRAVAWFRNLEKSLTSIRKQKEMELEVLVGAIKDFEGPDVGTLGEILLMNLLFVGREKQPRYFVLFSNTILILAYDNATNTLTYKGRIYVSGVTVSTLESDDSLPNLFEISGPTLHPILISCPSPSIRTTWLSTLNELLRTTRCYSAASHHQSNNQHLLSAQQAALSVSATSVNEHHHAIGGLTPPVQAWNITRLRPSAPYNPFLAEFKSGSVSGTTRSSSSSSGFERGNAAGSSFKFKSGSFQGIGMSTSSTLGVSNEEDLMLLDFVSDFCSSSNNRLSSAVTRNKINHTPTATSNSLSCHSYVSPNQPQVIHNQNIKQLPQLVTRLQKDVNLLSDRIGQLARQMEENKCFQGQLIELITKLGGGKISHLRNGNL